ncbi:alpha/beta hydrolase [Curtobacterium sp. VKM Ac-2887]|uniref:alpha/beta hydrolase n=1 Tax=Curtobacterium sp. VKM Ac-2887 TaxID=2783819 RepID=UPI00188CA4F8|nr:alpha/beta hydrolase [Curtobacterium sp. VKM Ac-2887]MBF4585699.1 alpha/beta hydrolase [Curtobacterium sp. VKM Ac-2887]
MPLHPYFAHRLEAVKRFPSIEQAMADPATAAQLAQAFHDDHTLPVPTGEVREQEIQTTVGPVAIRLYLPTSAADLGLVWVHGGGFAGGSIGMPESDTVARELAFEHGILVVTVDYALSNGQDVTYPIPHTQVRDAVEWVRAHRTELGLPDRPIALGGASAGASIALAATAELRDRDGGAPDALALVYPLLYRTLVDDSAIDAELSVELGPTRMSQRIVDQMYGAYTGGGQAPLADAADIELTGLPTLLTVVSEYDDLRPGGEAFHRAAVGAGVDAALYLAAGMPHGHLDRTREVPEVSGTVATLADFLRRATAD